MLSALGMAAALSAAWAPGARFSLVCQGIQTGYQELGGAKVSLPWSETFVVDLDKGTYCSQACTTSEPIAGVDALGLDLEKVVVPGVTSTRRFDLAGGGFHSVEVQGQTADRFRLEKTGTCTVKP